MITKITSITTTIKVLISAILLSHCCTISAASVDSGKPAGRGRIDIDLWNKSLQDAITQLTSRSGIDFIAAADISKPENFKNIKTFIQARNISALDAAEWIARAIGVRYRMADNGTTVIFTSSYHWLDKEKPVAKFYNIGGLLDWKDQKSFIVTIKELLKVYAVKSPEYSIRIRSDDQRLFAYLPDTLQDRLIAVLRAMSSKGRTAVKQDIPDYLSDLKNKLTVPIIFDYRDTEIQLIIADLSFQGNFNIGFSTNQMKGLLNKKVTFNNGACLLSEALKILCRKLNLAGFSYDPPHGIWLTNNTNEAGRTVGSRQILWESVPVQSFYIKNLINKKNLDTITRSLKNQISLDTVNDPSVSLTYHEHSGNLIVIAPASDQVRLENYLYSLSANKE
ncbi:MAG: hypothetical protein ACYTFY_01600 [Planctomycetota bacterium]|jgi:hypothetical protein